MHRSFALTLSCLTLSASFVMACSDSSGGSSGSFCTLAKTYDAQSKSIGESLASGDKDKVKQALDVFGSQINGMAKAAPAELKSELTLLKATTKDFVDVIAKADYDLQKVQDDPASAATIAKFRSDEVNTATDTVQQYLETTCGIKNDS